jgi:hypothetical protein
MLGTYTTVPTNCEITGASLLPASGSLIEIASGAKYLPRTFSELAVMNFIPVQHSPVKGIILKAGN